MNRSGIKPFKTVKYKPNVAIGLDLTNQMRGSKSLFGQTTLTEANHMQKQYMQFRSRLASECDQRGGLEADKADSSSRYDEVQAKAALL